MTTERIVDTETVKALEAEHVLQTYKRAPVVFVRGEGTVCSTPTASRISTSSRASASSCSGTAHAGLAAAIADQAATLIQTSNLYYHPLQGQLAARLRRSQGCSARSSATAAPKPSKRA